jgi:hypothetical protein
MTYDKPNLLLQRHEERYESEINNGYNPKSLGHFPTNLEAQQPHIIKIFLISDPLNWLALDFVT